MRDSVFPPANIGSVSRVTDRQPCLMAIFTAAFIVLFLIISFHAHSAELYGRVLKEDGGPASGINLTLKREGTSVDMTGITRDDGFYSFKNIPSGYYDLRIENREGPWSVFVEPTSTRFDIRY